MSDSSGDGSKPRTSAAEVLGFIARSEPLTATLSEFPGLGRDQLRSILREAAVLMKAREVGVPEQPPAPPLPPRAAPQSRQPAADRAPAARVQAPAPSAHAAEPQQPATVEHQTSAAGEKRLRVYSDGAARGNPGPAGAGAVVTKPDGTIVARVGKFLGNRTNNYAEYTGLILGLETALRLGATEVEVRADSELLIRQLQGTYKVKSELLRPLFEQTRALLRKFHRVDLAHVRREENADADEMSNRAIDERM